MNVQRPFVAPWLHSALQRLGRLVCVGAAIVGASACTGSTPATPTPPTQPAALRADVTDPVGDATADPRVAVAPDLVRAAATVDNGNLTLVVSFAPGTFDRQTTRVTALVDTDQSLSTGIKQQDGIGADYVLDLFGANAQATIAKADEAGCAARQTCFVTTGSAPLTVLSDGLQAVVPLSALGTTTGRVSFQVTAYVLVAPLTPVVFDLLPDANLAPARVQ
jgi:hypothetical protein